MQSYSPRYLNISEFVRVVRLLKTNRGQNITRVSKAAADLMAYCDAHSCDDPLISPVPTSENPFREKKFFCALL
uniref:Guanine nucleotide-binding protein subunit gamma n=1 Tax=Sparus aurata TaxID=8175 RepID=A0A671TML5_SPAAU